MHWCAQALLHHALATTPPNNAPTAP
jgi:hypothetical protein